MGEPSPEAIVAADAAASAVEELHAREDIAEAADDAAEESMIAASAAEDAGEQAEAAVEAAVIAVEAAVEAQQTAGEAVQHSASTDEQLAQLRDEMAELRPAFGEMYQEWRSNKDAESAEPVVQEVPVNAAPASDSNQNTASRSAETSAKDDSSGQETASPRTRNNGLRRRRR